MVIIKESSNKDDIISAVELLQKAHYLDVTLSTLNVGMHHTAVQVDLGNNGIQVTDRNKPVLFVAIPLISQVNTIQSNIIDFKLRTGEKIRFFIT